MKLTLRPEVMHQVQAAFAELPDELTRGELAVLLHGLLEAYECRDDERVALLAVLLENTEGVEVHHHDDDSFANGRGDAPLQ